MAADVATSKRTRLRQLGVLVVFIVGALASIATSPSVTYVDVPGQQASLRLDDEHPTALMRFVVSLNAEASAGSGSEGATLRIASVRGPSDTVQQYGGPFGGADRARFIVASVQPGV